MGAFWDSFKQGCKEQWETDSRRGSGNECFFWPGVVFIALCLVLVVSKFISCYY